MSRPNVLLVTVDSLRADFAYGDRATTPTVDRLAEAGTTFRRAFAQGPFTTFSMPSLFTGRYPSDLDPVEIGTNAVGVAINDEPTIQSVLGAEGYETAGFHSNPLLSNLFGFEEGFDAFDARLPFSETGLVSGRAKILVDKLRRMVRRHPYLPAERINDRAFDWLDARRDDRPFFLWLHYMDVHGPYRLAESVGYLDKFRSERLWRRAVTSPDAVDPETHDRLLEGYRNEVVYADDCLGTLVDGLERRDLFEETVVVLTADHGEGFGEHGRYSHPHQLYDELLHVPLVIRDPRRGSADSDRVTELLDVAPTIVSLVDGEVPGSFRGRSLFGREDHAGTSTADGDGRAGDRTAVEDGDPPAGPDDRAAISEADLVPEYAGSVRTSGWRYVRTADGPELYDLAADPGQQRDLADRREQVRSVLADRLDAHLADTGWTGADASDVRTSEVDAETRSRLEDLGYLNE